MALKPLSIDSFLVIEMAFNYRPPHTDVKGGRSGAGDRMSDEKEKYKSETVTWTNSMINNIVAVRRKSRSKK